MKHYLLLLLFITVSCGVDEDILHLEEEGYVEFSMSFILDKQASTSKVPDCLNKQPTQLKCRLLNSLDLSSIDTVSISITDNIVTLNEPLVYPINEYLLDEVSLLADDGTITHTIPHVGRDLSVITP